MAISVRCPNDACGKMLEVRDDFAGKTGKCPSCGSTMPIPDAAAEDIVEATEDVPPVLGEEIPVRRFQGRRRHEYDEFEEPRPRRRSRYDEDDLPVVRRSRPGSGVFVGTIVCLSIGIGLLLFLGFTPLFSMFFVASNPNFGEILPQSWGSGGLIRLTEGKILMIGSLVMAALCAAGLIVFLTAAERIGANFVTICSCLAGGWSVAALFWNLAFIWDINTMSFYSQTLPNSRGTGMTPGAGLWIGLGMSIGSVAVFSILFSIRGGTAWLYLGEGLGLLAGVLLLTLNVQPWDTGETVHPRDPLFMKTKMFKRYLPLQPLFLWDGPDIRFNIKR